MIKKTIRLMPIVAMATTGFLFGCVDSDKDLYDSSYEMPNHTRAQILETLKKNEPLV